MENGQAIGYAKIFAAGKLKKILEDKSYGLDLQENFQNKDLKKIMKSLGITNSPEEQIRENARKGLGKFTLRKVGSQEETLYMFKNCILFDEISGIVEKLSPEAFYRLSPFQNLEGEYETIYGTLDINDSRNADALLVGYMQPHAEITNGGSLLKSGAKVGYDKYIFPIKNYLQNGI